MTKMAILGRGSMRDRQKEEELRLSGDPKFCHLQLELHVEVTALAPPAEAHARIALALAEVRRFLVPDFNDDIRQEQMWELHVLKSSRDHLKHLASGPAGPGPACLPASHASLLPDVAAAGGRKRPYIAMSPTKRTVLSILARARAPRRRRT
ncbi:hypothetical protein ONE63_004986 [Megalurothrips usitatus]|uniref:Uncharacterized protein n=1 Tax=Megalurothrips usitatus TaxID=439358 RepID=A0AAV7X5Q2_9NEOP|nr:hypothetical protein ONE63_004986 [Megalurothrips usitatus]